MKYLIVNADDLGAGPAVTRGILEAHTRGIVTSASLMVETPWSAEAASRARSMPSLSVGLHAVLPEGAAVRAGQVDPGPALRHQVDRFVALMGRLPTHLDSHHNAHRAPGLEAGVLAFSRELGLPLRGHSPARYYPRFYGQWGGESHPEQIGVESLVGMLEREVGPGVTELSCHPGFHDPRVPSGYGVEREVELRTLCDPRVRAALTAFGITLSSFHDLNRLTATGISG